MATRRNFIKKTSLGVVATASLNSNFMIGKNILGANDRIYCAIAGVRSRGKAHAAAINLQKNAKILFSCDVDDIILDEHNKWSKEKIGYVPQVEKDFRKLVENKDIDAVFIASPEHWHTPGAIMAMQAGKHVYLEKPCSHNMHENELVVAAQEKYNKVVQMGNQQRSSLETAQIVKDIHNGIIGKTYKATAFYINSRGEVPLQTKAAPPEGLDWDLFQGPAPRRDYTHNTWDYNWHWYGWDFGTAEMGNNATHELDVARWALGVELPTHVHVRSGKNQYLNDGWE